jgi:hypothetical protein
VVASTKGLARSVAASEPESETALRLGDAGEAIVVPVAEAATDASVGLTDEKRRVRPICSGEPDA